MIVDHQREVLLAFWSQRVKKPGNITKESLIGGIVLAGAGVWGPTKLFLKACVPG